MKNIDSSIPSQSSKLFSSTLYVATEAAKASAKPANIKTAVITIFIVLAIGVVSGCISMIYCYYFHKKSMQIQSQTNINDISSPIIALDENNSNYTKTNDAENPNTN